MKEFIKEIFIKGAIVLLFCISTSALIYQLDFDHYDFYELPEVVNRKNNFNQFENNINTVFVGSSRIFRHIDPEVFDSITGLSSYNLGYAGLFPFRSYDFLEKLAIEDTQIKNIFIELAPLALLGQNFNTEPFIHSIDLKKFSIALSFSNNEVYTKQEQLKYTLGYSMLFFYKYSGLGVSKYLNQTIFKTADFRENRDSDNIYTQGYLSLDDDLKSHGSDYQNLQVRRDEFHGNSQKWLNLYRSANESYLKDPVTMIQKDDFTEYIENVADSLVKRGIKVHFIISPRQVKSDLYYLRNQKKWLEDYKVYDFSDANEYATIFTESTSFDRVHLNEDGAEELTEILANLYIQNNN